MLERVTEWFANGGTYLTVGVGSLIAAVPVLKSALGAFKNLKELLPQKVQEAVDGKMSDLETKLEQVKTSSDQFKLEETIITCKAKLESSVLSDEIKKEYYDLMAKAQSELREVYGVVKEIPSGEII